MSKNKIEINKKEFKKKLAWLFFFYNVYMFIFILGVILVVNHFDITGRIAYSTLGLMAIVIILHSRVYYKIRIGLSLETEHDKLYEQLGIPKRKHE